ncbi:MAG TPA: serine/threonine-protein kinase [Thermoanaerobaculia bacterium]|nr:serine/threonine-protein kinase [Thermoanaerobaculia bacterium]
MELTCLRCKTPLDTAAEACPQCGERVTHFQRTYSTRLIDGKYQIMERLGLGGMGEIFKVKHIHLNEERVIKIMRSNIASDDQSLQRFLQEARTSTMIKHRNLAMLYDFSTLDDGSYYMVWEFIDGTNIQKWVATNGAMPARMATEISLQSLTGLENLHSMGLIHRDISPENIMLSQDYQGRLLAKVIDFGIAKQLSEGEAGQGLTQTGMFVGKLKYASPEQAGFMKEGETIDARSDLYSFGIVFYEMLAGRAPFLATNPQGYILKHVTEKPLPISKVNPDVTVPPELERIIMKSLEKDRDNRYLSAADFIDDLEAIREDIPPDKVYGVGDKIGGTLSGRSSAPGTRTGAQRTRTGTGTQAGRTRSGAIPTGTIADSGTIVDRIDGGAGQATVVEKMGGGAASATVVEAKGGWEQGAGAEPTVIERKSTVVAPREAKSKAPLFGAIAAVVVLLIGVGIYYATRSKPPVTVPGSGTTTTGSGTAGSPDQGVLLLTSPFGEMAKIVNADTNKEVLLSDNVVPLRQKLPPGKYHIILSSSDGGQETEDVTLAAGQVREIKSKPNRVDTEKVTEEILRK